MATTKTSNRPMQLRSGRRVLGEMTNKAPASDAQLHGNAKKPRLQRHMVEAAASSSGPTALGGLSSAALSAAASSSKLSSFSLVPMPAQPFEDVPPVPMPLARPAAAAPQEEPEPQWMAQLPAHERKRLVHTISQAMREHHTNQLRSSARAKVQTDLEFRYDTAQIAEAVAWVSQTPLTDEMEIDGSDAEHHGFQYGCDVADKPNPNMVVEYVDELYAYYKDAERLKAPSMYMHLQNDITARMRAILIDWLVDVSLKFRCMPGTLYLCVHLIDCFCTSNAVRRSRLQLVGITALLVAAKYEEIYPPEVKECVDITDQAYTPDEVREMERVMLEFFSYNITTPTSHHFLVRFLKVAGVQVPSRTSHRAAFFSERCLQEHEMLVYKPSHIASAAVFLALTVERAAAPAGWEERLLEFSGYSRSQLMPCARRIAEHVSVSPCTPTRRPLHAIQKKFESVKFSKVAEEEPPTL